MAALEHRKLALTVGGIGASETLYRCDQLTCRMAACPRCGM